jgi:hypothetical protein
MQMAICAHLFYYIIALLQVAVKAESCAFTQRSVYLTASGGPVNFENDIELLIVEIPRLIFMPSFT